MIKLKIDDRGTKRLMNALSESELKKAHSRVLNQVGAKVRTETARGIRGLIALKARDVNSAMQVRRSTPNRLQWEMVASGRRISLIKFGARQTRRGVTVRIRPKGGRTTLQRAFIARGRRGFDAGGAEQVFRRKGSGRLPIVKLTGPSIPQTMSNRIVERAWTSLVRRDYPTQMARELQFRIDKAAR